VLDPAALAGVGRRVPYVFLTGQTEGLTTPSNAI